MTARTRYFVIASLLVLAVGLGTGLVAFYVGLPTAGASPAALDELQLIPRSASLVAYANVHDIMASDLRQRVHRLVPSREDGRKEFEAATGINIETDVDHLVAGIVPEQNGGAPVGGVVVVRGRFDSAKIEALMQQHGAQIEEYQGRRLIVAAGSNQRGNLSLAFIEPSLVAVGSTPMVRTAVDLKSGGDDVTQNDELMTRLRALSGTAWAVGRFDTLAAHTQLPAGFASQLPPITWFSANASLDQGLRGAVRVDARDEEAANNLREVVRGFVALAKLQASSQPAVKTAVDSISLQGTGTTVSLSFDLPAEAVDQLGSALHR